MQQFLAQRHRRDELRHFLRSRRARLSPEDVGMVGAGRRGTPGLRREEVAVMAGVGVSWYTWLEQGRAINVSDNVLDAISRTLRLDEGERSYLYLLAGLNPPKSILAEVKPISPELQRILDGWSPRPAFVLDQYCNFEAINDAARIVFDCSVDDHNFLVMFFTSARYRTALTSWAAMAPGIVATFRADAANYPDDPEFERLANDLRAVSPEFAKLWECHDVCVAPQGVKTVTHPEVGELTFECICLPLPDRPGHRVILSNPKLDTDTWEKLEKLMASRSHKEATSRSESNLT